MEYNLDKGLINNSIHADPKSLADLGQIIPLEGKYVSQKRHRCLTRTFGRD
jgi:hypothetical protein